MDNIYISLNEDLMINISSRLAAIYSLTIQHVIIGCSESHEPALMSSMSPLRTWHILFRFCGWYEYRYIHLLQNHTAFSLFAWRKFVDIDRSKISVWIYAVFMYSDRFYLNIGFCYKVEVRLVESGRTRGILCYLIASVQTHVNNFL